MMRTRFFSGTTRKDTKDFNRRDLLRLAIAAALVLAGGTTWRYSQVETVVQAEMTPWSQQALQILGPLML